MNLSLSLMKENISKPTASSESCSSANEVYTYDICVIAEVRSNNTSMSYEVILKTERQREITKVAARGTTLPRMRTYLFEQVFER